MRREDPRILAAIHGALGDARTVVNVGAGAGSYEPRDREVVAVEPSETMIAQRPPGAAPVVRAHAEELPFADGEFDVAMAALTDHHWRDRAGGLRELRRVSLRTVVFTYDPAVIDETWVTRDYLPGFRELPGMTIEEIAACLGGAAVDVVPIPHDCLDGFFHAYWRRPEAYLDPVVRASISVFSRVSRGEVEAFVAQLGADLESGAWHERNAAILERDALDCGYRLLTGPA